MCSLWRRIAGEAFGGGAVGSPLRALSGLAGARIIRRRRGLVTADRDYKSGLLSIQEALLLCAEHVGQLGSESLLLNLMEVKS